MIEKNKGEEKKMKGSEKQIKWACDIKGKMIGDMIASFPKSHQDQGRKILNGEVEAPGDMRYVMTVLAIDDAKYWIDNRDERLADLARAMMAKMS